MKLRSLFLAISAVSTFGALPASAALTLLYATNFNSPTYSDGALIGQDGWALTGSTVSPIAVANTATNGNVSLVATGQDVFRSFTPALSPTDSIVLTATINVTSAKAAGDYFLHLGAGAVNFNARLFVKSSGAGYVMALGTGSGTVTYGTDVLAFNTAQSILLRYDFVAGLGNDTGALYVSPTSEDGYGDTPYVLATTVGVDAGVISSVNLRQGTTADAPTVIVDNLVVSSVPEPTTALLGALGFLAILRRRR